MYSGVKAQIPLGLQGLISDMTPGQIPPTALIKCTNMSFGPGYLEKASGSMKYNTTPLSSGIVGLFDYWPNTATQRMFAATKDGSLYRDIGDRLFSGGVAIKSGLHILDNRCMFVEGGQETTGRTKKLFFFSASNQVQVLADDNHTFADISKPASDWTSSKYPRIGLIHRNRHFAFAGQNFYASTTSDHEDFQSSNILVGTIGPGEGGDIQAAYVYKGKMLVFKEGDFVYVLDDSDSDSSNWFFYKFGNGFGVASTHAALEVLDDLLVGNNHGTVTSYKAVQSFGDLAAADLFSLNKLLQFIRTNTTPSGSFYFHSLYYPEKKVAYFTARTKFRTENDAIVVMDVSDSQGARFSFWTKDLPDCLALRRDIYKIQRPMYGDTNGYVYLMDSENRDVGGIAYTGEFKTPHLDFRHLDPALTDKNKLYDWLGVTFAPEGNHNMSVDVFIDGKFSETIDFLQTVDTNYMGSFVLGTSKLGQEEEQTYWKPLHGSGRRISFRCYNGNADQNFRACLLTVGFRPSGEQPTRLTGG